VTTLVTAASKHEATWEIAERIGAVLVQAGIETTVLPVEVADEPDRYDAAVIGSAIYYGKWLEPARRYVERYAEMLRARPVWLFSSGPLGDPPHPAEAESAQVDALVAASGAREHRLFTGRLDRDLLGRRERILARAVKAPEGDFRDWTAIDRWAREIARVLSGDTP
jgi:menaquinone-dependent protoporphyrinogen oxidase